MAQEVVEGMLELTIMVVPLGLDQSALTTLKKSHPNKHRQILEMVVPEQGRPLLLLCMAKPVPTVSSQSHISSTYEQSLPMMRLHCMRSPLRAPNGQREVPSRAQNAQRVQSPGVPVPRSSDDTTLRV